MTEHASRTEVHLLRQKSGAIVFARNWNATQRAAVCAVEQRRAVLGEYESVKLGPADNAEQSSPLVLADEKAVTDAVERLVPSNFVVQQRALSR